MLNTPETPHRFTSGTARHSPPQVVQGRTRLFQPRTGPLQATGRGPDWCHLPVAGRVFAADAAAGGFSRERPGVVAWQGRKMHRRLANELLLRLARRALAIIAPCLR